MKKKYEGMTAEVVSFEFNEDVVAGSAGGFGGDGAVLDASAGGSTVVLL